MLVAYFDDTGRSEDELNLFVGMAAFLAAEKDWELFNARWQSICAKHGVEMPFHMLEFAQFKGQFQNWRSDGDEKRKKLLSELVAAICGARPVVAGAVCSVNDFRSLSPDSQSALISPYNVVFQATTHQLGFAAGLASYPPERVRMIYAAGGQYKHAQELWNAIRRYNLYGYWMESISSGNPRTEIPLQAADIWAYELGHHFGYIIPKQKPFRWPFVQITNLAIQTSLGHKFFEYFDGKTLLSIIGE